MTNSMASEHILGPDLMKKHQEEKSREHLWTDASLNKLTPKRDRLLKMTYQLINRKLGILKPLSQVLTIDRAYFSISTYH